jgi:hypothetical protein
MSAVEAAHLQDSVTARPLRQTQLQWVTRESACDLPSCGLGWGDPWFSYMAAQAARQKGLGIKWTIHNLAGACSVARQSAEENSHCGSDGHYLICFLLIHGELMNNAVRQRASRPQEWETHRWVHWEEGPQQVLMGLRCCVRPC